MKTDFSSLDLSILAVLTESPLRLGEILAVAVVRDEALRINRRRAGVSPSASADITINERLQSLRRRGRVAHDSATSRWEGQPITMNRSSPMQGTVLDTANRFVEWTHNGSNCGRHASTLSAPLQPTHGQR